MKNKLKGREKVEKREENRREKLSEIREGMN